MRRILSLWLPMLAVEVWARRRRTDKPAQAYTPEHPLTLTAEAHNALFVAAANHAALAAGIAPGMSLADARALEPGIETAPQNPAADAAMLERLADWCGRYTPWVALSGRDGLWLDVTGCAHLFGGEAAMLRDIRERLQGFGFGARLAIADTAGAAWALAHFGGDMTVTAPGEQRRAMAKLPVAALRLTPRIAADLSRLGLTTIGDLYPMPRGSLTKRFGLSVGERLDQALGRLAEPLSPRRPPPRSQARRAFAEAIGRREDIDAALLLLLDEVCTELARAGLGARRLVFDLFRVDGGVESVAVGTAYPARDAERLARLFAEPLGQVEAGFGIEAMTLSVAVVEPLAAEQTDGLGGIGGEDATAPLAPLLDRLGNRLGFAQVRALTPRQSHLPDRAVRPAAPLQHAPGKPDWPEKPLRPLRMLHRPEAVEAVTGLAPHQPPLSFRWRKVVHRVAAAEGPERIAPEWWHSDKAWAGGLRDYWRIEDREGRRFWLFCEAADAPGPPRWYLHGLFA